MMGAAATLVISQLMTTMYLAQIVSVAIAILVVLRAGPTRAYSLAIVSVIAACPALYYVFYLVRPAGFAEAVQPIAHNIYAGLFAGVSPVLLFWLFVPIMFAGLGRGTLNLVPWSVYNYLPDVDEAVTGQRREGIFAGVDDLSGAQAVAIRRHHGGDDGDAARRLQVGVPTSRPQARSMSSR